MRKVIKIFLSVLSLIILTILIASIMVWLLLFLPPVQKTVAKRFTQMASQTLGTRIEFDKVRFRLFNTVELDGLYVEDHAGDTLAYMKSLRIGVDPWTLLAGKIALDEIKLTGGKVDIRRYGDGTSNLGRIVAKLSSDEPKPVRFGITSLTLNDMSLYYSDPARSGQANGRIDFADVKLTSVNLRADNISVRGNGASLHLNSLGFRDKSGFELSSLSCRRIAASENGILLDRLKIVTPDSDIDIPTLNLVYEDWDDLSQPNGDVGIEARMRNSTLSSRTAAFFIPAMQGRDIALGNFNTEISGTLDSFSGTLGTSLSRQSFISLDRFTVKGVLQPANANFSIDAITVITNGHDISSFYGAIKGSPYADSLPGPIAGLDGVTLNGSFHGSAHDFAAVGDICSTSQGNAHIDLKLRPEGARKNTSIEGTVSVEDLDLGGMLGNDDLGRISALASVDGSFGPKHLGVDTRARLALLQYRGYDYRNVRMDGRFINREFTGAIGSDDPNIDFSFNGTLDFNDSIPRYDFALRMRNADLKNLNINKRDSISSVRFNVRMSGSGDRFDNFNGDIVIDDMLYITHPDTVETGRITLAGRNAPDSKYLGMRSPFADADFSSRTSYRMLADYFRTALLSYIPSLSPPHDGHTAAENDNSHADDADDYSVISLNVKQAGRVAEIFIPGLIVAEGTKASVTFNPAAGKFSFNLSSDYLELGNKFISKLDVNSRYQADSLILFVRADEVYAAGMLFPNFSIIGGAKNNMITASARFTNPDNGQSALIGTVATLGRNDETGTPQVEIRFSPSFFTHGGQQWNISNREIVADRTKIVIRDFTVTGADQQLRVDGTVSANISDTVSLSMSGFDIAPLAAMLNTGYAINGRSTGRVNISSALNGGGMIRAGIRIDSMLVNDVRVPDLLISSSWDVDNRVAPFSVTERESGKTLIAGHFDPASRNYDATAKLENLDMSLIDPHYEDVLSQTKGRADADLSITGTGGKLKLNGSARVRDYAARVDYLNVVYSMHDQRIKIADNVLSFDGAKIHDPAGNSASADMRLDMNRLNNVSYSFNIRPENMIVLNTTEYDNELFYGRVFASGNTTIKGSKRGVDIDITAETSGDSEFYMPLSDKSDMSDVDFVTFVQPRRPRPDSTGYAMRRRAIMGSNRRNRRISNTGSTNINIALSVRPNTMIELLIDPQTGHRINARGNGRMNMHINPRNGEFTMYGDYRINEGTYLFTLENIIEKQFAIEPGSHIQWTGDPIDALLNISAVYRLKTSIGAAMGSSADESYRRARVPIECRIMLSDRLSLPTTSFSISAPGALPETKSLLDNFLNTQEMMATQFFFLLATGGFYDEGTQGNIGAAAGSQVAFDFLSNQFSNWVSSDHFNIGIRYRPRTELSSDEWGVDFSQHLFGDRILLEVEGNYTNRENSAPVNNNVKNFTGDFYLTALLSKSGDLKAKVFTRTIDRFDENQGLQESGVGLYYSEDFNTFGDILRNIMERFTGERRRKRSLRGQPDTTTDETVATGETGETGASEKKTENNGVNF